MGTQTAAALRHVRTLAPYNAVSFAEQNKALVGKSARLSGFGFVSINVGTDITLEPGSFISVGLALNPTDTDRIAGIIAETTANVVIPIDDVNPDFYLFALVQTPSEGTTVDFLSANSPVPPNSQYAPIARYIAGQFILEDALSDAGLEEQVTKAREDSGADQFYLTFEPNSSPLEINLTAANLSDGTEFPATSNYGGAPAFAAPGTNYVWFDPGIAAIQNNTTGFPSDVLPLWEFVLDGSSNVTSLIDRRPFFGGGGGAGDASAIEERLKEILQHSVMQNARFSTIATSGAPDVGGSSNGTFLGPSEYELDNGEILESAFVGAALEAPADVSQVTVAVLVDQLLLPGDLLIEVAKDGAPTFEPGPGIENFTNYVFTGAAGNELQIRITNQSGGTITVRGYGLYYNNIGGPTGVLEAQTGLVEDASGLNFYNTNVNAAHFAASDFGFTWDAVTGGGTLSWDSVQAGTPDNLRIEVTDPANETVVNTITAPGSLAGITAGAYVYFDVNRAGGPISLVVSPGGPPPMQRDRHIFGRRIPEPNGGNDEFIIYDDFKLLDVNDNPNAIDQPFPPPLLPITTIQSILTGNSVVGTPTHITNIAPGVGAAGPFDTVYNVPPGASNIWIFSQLNNGSATITYSAPSVFMGVYDVANVIIRGIRSAEFGGLWFGRVEPVFTTAALAAPGVNLNQLSTNVAGYTSLYGGTTTSFVIRQHSTAGVSGGHSTFLVAT